MKTEEEIFNLNLDFSLLQGLVMENGLEKPICKKHALNWYHQCTSYVTTNMMYVISLESTRRMFTGVAEK